ncbi:MAG: Dyp-type peroxidase [Kordiimonadaceae bacterium]|jgi:porphyrinogen peroxidase|nr:Dyp-type peroxidase [Kordiimonadaceae bacterium]MBT6032080.1 Dyp-type peroxidase [Kordiimonadaceae bacterium]
MKYAQPSILAEETTHARYISFTIRDKDKISATLKSLAEYIDLDQTVIGLGQELVKSTGAEIPGLRVLPAQNVGEIEIPSTPDDLWLWLRGTDRGELFHRSRKIEEICLPAFEITSAVDSFQYSENRDLSGYVDGTENPEGEDAVNAAIFTDGQEGLNGGSFVAVQQWLHDFDILNEMSTEEKDDAVGRHISDNEEFDAPKSAHVKRSAQEDFSPEAFMLRRSMPWAMGTDAGLMFVAFGHSFDPFEAILDRMMGQDDGIMDGIFKFTLPITGAYYWCPPVKDGKIDLRALNLN